MLKYFLKRLIFSIFALFILLTIIYLLMSLLPTIPISKNPHETDDQYLKALESLGLTKPLAVRYGEYWKNLFSGNLGLIYSKSGTTIQEEIFPRLPNTMYVAGLAFLLSILFGFTFGIIAAVYRGRWQDTLVNILSVLFISVPSFVIGVLLLKLAGVINLPQKFANFGDFGWNTNKFIASSIMPIFSLTFGIASTLTYYVRNEIVEVMNQDYIKTARSKGLSSTGVMFKHALRNSSIPALSILGPSLLGVISGSIILEQMFGVSGVASILVNAIQLNEVNEIMFQALFFSGLYFLIIIILDISYTYIDPRIKLSQQNDASLYSYSKFYTVRHLWVNRWKNLTNKRYNQVDLNSSLHRFLVDNSLINYRKKTVVLYDWCYQTYQLNEDSQFLSLGKDVLKINRVAGTKKGAVNEQ